MLARFLGWRNDLHLNPKQFFKSKIPNSIWFRVQTTMNFLETKFILSNNFWYFYLKKKSFNSEKTQNQNFFPNQRSFFYYWLFPFVGFVGLTFLSSENRSIGTTSGIYAISNLTDTQNTTLTNLNSQPTSKMLREIPELFYKQNSVALEKTSLFGWETLEYLNYKKFLLDTNLSVNKEQNNHFLLEGNINTIELNNNKSSLSSRNRFVLNISEKSCIQSEISTNNFNKTITEDSIATKTIKQTNANTVTHYSELLREIMYNDLKKSSSLGSDTVRPLMDDLPRSINPTNQLNKLVSFKKRVKTSSTTLFKNIQWEAFCETILGRSFIKKSTFYWNWYLLQSNLFTSWKDTNLSINYGFSRQKQTRVRGVSATKSGNIMGSNQVVDFNANTLELQSEKQNLLDSNHSFNLSSTNQLWLDLDEFPKKLACFSFAAANKVTDINMLVTKDPAASATLSNNPATSVAVNKFTDINMSVTITSAASAPDTDGSVAKAPLSEADLQAASAADLSVSGTEPSLKQSKISSTNVSGNLASRGNVKNLLQLNELRLAQLIQPQLPFNSIPVNHNNSLSFNSCVDEEIHEKELQPYQPFFKNTFNLNPVESYQKANYLLEVIKNKLDIDQNNLGLKEKLKELFAKSIHNDFYPKNSILSQNDLNKSSRQSLVSINSFNLGVQNLVQTLVNDYPKINQKTLINGDLTQQLTKNEVSFSSNSVFSTTNSVDSPIVSSNPPIKDLIDRLNNMKKTDSKNSSLFQQRYSELKLFKGLIKSLDTNFHLVTQTEAQFKNSLSKAGSIVEFKNNVVYNHLKTDLDNIFCLTLKKLKLTKLDKKKINNWAFENTKICNKLNLKESKYVLSLLTNRLAIINSYNKFLNSNSNKEIFSSDFRNLGVENPALKISKTNLPIIMSGFEYPELNLDQTLILKHQLKNQFKTRAFKNKNKVFRELIGNHRDSKEVFCENISKKHYPKKHLNIQAHKRHSLKNLHILYLSLNRSNTINVNEKRLARKHFTKMVLPNLKPFGYLYSTTYTNKYSSFYKESRVLSNRVFKYSLTNRTSIPTIKISETTLANTPASIKVSSLDVGAVADKRPKGRLSEALDTSANNSTMNIEIGNLIRRSTSNSAKNIYNLNRGLKFEFDKFLSSSLIYNKLCFKNNLITTTNTVPKWVYTNKTFKENTKNVSLNTKNNEPTQNYIQTLVNDSLLIKTQHSFLYNQCNSTFFSVADVRAQQLLPSPIKTFTSHLVNLESKNSLGPSISLLVKELHGQSSKLSNIMNSYVESICHNISNILENKNKQYMINTGISNTNSNSSMLTFRNILTEPESLITKQNPYKLESGQDFEEHLLTEMEVNINTPIIEKNDRVTLAQLYLQKNFIKKKRSSTTINSGVHSSSQQYSTCTMSLSPSLIKRENRQLEKIFRNYLSSKYLGKPDSLALLTNSRIKSNEFLCKLPGSSGQQRERTFATADNLDILTNIKNSLRTKIRKDTRKKYLKVNISLIRQNRILGKTTSTSSATAASTPAAKAAVLRPDTYVSVAKAPLKRPEGLKVRFAYPLRLSGPLGRLSKDTTAKPTKTLVADAMNTTAKLSKRLPALRKLAKQAMNLPKANLTPTSQIKRKSTNRTTNTVFSPNSILKKMSFLFLKKNNSLKQPTIRSNKSNLLRLSWIKNEAISLEIPLPGLNQNKKTLKVLTKQKIQQKKRRSKKRNVDPAQLIEIKRRRSYPRPLWLRFPFYKRFLKIRHYNRKFPQSQFNSWGKQKIKSNIAGVPQTTLSATENPLKYSEALARLLVRRKDSNTTMVKFKKSTSNLLITKATEIKKTPMLGYLYRVTELTAISARSAKVPAFQNEPSTKTAVLRPGSDKPVTDGPAASATVFNDPATNVAVKKFTEATASGTSVPKVPKQNHKFHNFLINYKKNNSSFYNFEKSTSSSAMRLSHSKKASFRKKIYRNNKQKWGNYLIDTPNFEKVLVKQSSFLWSLPLFVKTQFFQISNNVLGDFKRMLWKSYWLRSNFDSYINRIETSMTDIKKTYSSSTVIPTLRNFFLYLLGFNVTYATNVNYLNNLSKITNSLPIENTVLIDLNMLNSQKSLIHQTSLLRKKYSIPVSYFNIKNSLETNSSFNLVYPFANNFRNSQNYSEYSRLLYLRIQDIIKDIKNNLTISGYSKSRSAKIGRRKREKVSVSNFGARLGRFINLEMTPIPIVPTGEQANARIMWALTKTISQAKWNRITHTQSIWNTAKIRKQKKSNKTKKLFHNFLKTIKITSPVTIEEPIPNIVRTEIQLDQVQNKQKRLYALGLKTPNQKLYLRKFKFNFKTRKSKLNSKTNTAKNVEVFKDQDSHLLKSLKYPKRDFTYWWDPIYTDQLVKNSILESNKEGIKRDRITGAKTNNTSFPKIPTLGLNNLWKVFQNNEMALNRGPFVISFSSSNSGVTSLLWTCLLLFHVCSLFALLGLSELRSLVKFYILLIYKISNIYLTLVYSLHNTLNNYISLMFGLYIKNKLELNRSQKYNWNKKFQNVGKFNKGWLLSYIPRSQNKATVILSSQRSSVDNLVLEKPRIFKMSYIPYILISEIQLPQTEIEMNKLRDKLQNSSILTLTHKNGTSTPKLNNFGPVKPLNNKNPDRQFISLTSQFSSLKKIFFKSLLSSEMPSPSRILFNKYVYTETSRREDLPIQNTLLKSTIEDSNKIGFQRFQTSLDFQSTGKRSLILFNRYMQSLVYFSIFSVLQFSLKFYKQCFLFFYSFFLKIIDLLESFMLIIYKFLEKPAEFMVDWIAQIFLIEWSADLITYIPENLDEMNFKTIQKTSRGLRLLGPLGLLLQRRILCILENFIEILTKPDIDLMVRQKKGILFWDIWAEFLTRAADEYNINIPSLTTLKEEQELLIQKLLEDEQWKWNEFFMNTNSSHCLVRFSNTSRQKPDTKVSVVKDPKQNITTNSVVKNVKNNLTKASFGLALTKNVDSLLATAQEKFENIAFSEQQIEQIWSRWSAHQYLTYQGFSSELLEIDIHPPKAFSHFNGLKYSEPVQQPIGTLVCQIYSGLFIKQVSKNILVVGSPGTSKSLLIQALAGETELKIMTDHANRYAIVQRGVALGMKLLRDVFDALSLHTPCLFLIEDIHLIGERRPMLISDDENAKATKSSTVFSGIESEEVHEKNQVIYQLTKHSISHYRKPYKGDFSLLIPTNHFCFDLFLGVSPARTRRSNRTPQSPLPLDSIKNEINASMSKDPNQSMSNNELSLSNSILASKLQSRQNSSDIFAPPSTSPFSLLLLKEQNKLKPKKLVKQILWGGVPSDQMMQLSKANYSIRIKVALLADLAISNLSVKLDMITDLLIIIDSVRSNRGFVVFATTHLPYILDPALRRPGRLDETINLPLLPNLFNRWEIVKMYVADFSNTLDLVDFTLMSKNLSEIELSNLLSRTKLSLLTTPSFELLARKNSMDILKQIRDESLPSNFSLSTLATMYREKSLRLRLLDPKYSNNKIANVPEAMYQNSTNLAKLPNLTSPTNLTVMTSLKSYFKEPDRVLTTTKNSMTAPYVQSLNQALRYQTTFDILPIHHMYNNSLNKQLRSTMSGHPTTNILNSNPNSQTILKPNLNRLNSYKIGASPILTLTYSQVGKFIIHTKLVKDSSDIFSTFWTEIPKQQAKSEPDSMFNILYSPRQELKSQLIKLFAGKITESFIMRKSSQIKFMLASKSNPISSNTLFEQLNIEESTKNLPSMQEKWWESIKTFGYESLWSLHGIDDIWRSASSLIFSLIQKRCLYNKNTLVQRFLYLQDLSSLKEPPSPPASSILIPAKRFENLKRTEHSFETKAFLSIREKIQLHQQQRLIKTLYNKPIQTAFPSELNQKRSTVFATSSRELGYIDSSTTRLSSIQSYYRDRILIRHRFYFTNQWWNAHLPEQNAETTFLSDVDWRYMFVESVGDVVIDFPDTDQHYNPRRRRWMCSTGSWNYWQNFDKTFHYEIYSHYLIESFTKAYELLNNNREILDYFAYIIMNKGVLKEVDSMITAKRFYF